MPPAGRVESPRSRGARKPLPPERDFRSRNRGSRRGDDCRGRRTPGVASDPGSTRIARSDKREPPRLGVVAVGRQRRVANTESFRAAGAGQVETVAVPPRRPRPRPRRLAASPDLAMKRGSASGGDDDSGACEEPEKTVPSGVFHCTRQVCRGLVYRRRRKRPVKTAFGTLFQRNPERGLRPRAPASYLHAWDDGTSRAFRRSSCRPTWRCPLKDAPNSCALMTVPRAFVRLPPRAASL